MSEKLLNTPASILAAYLIAQSKMTDPSDKDNWPLYKSHMPDGMGVKTNAEAIYDIGGVKDSKSMNGVMSEHQGVHLIIRCQDYETGYVKIEDINFTLGKVVNASVTIDSNSYALQNVSRQASVIPIGMDEKRRYSFSMDFLLTLAIV